MVEYIEREAAKENVKHIPWCDWKAVGDCLDSIPAADVEAVKHGRWDADCCCTVCGEEAIYYWERSCHEYTKRCPNCGAKMDLEG